MDTEITPHCETLGFDEARIRRVIQVLGLAEHAPLAARLREEIIAANARPIVDACFTTLTGSRDFPLIEEHIGAGPLRHIWEQRLQCFGDHFDTPRYFEARLAMAYAFARGKIPLSLLQLLYGLTQQSLVSRILERTAAADFPGTYVLLDTVLKLTLLDFFLSAEGYRLPELEEMRENLDKLRAEASRLRKKTSTDALTGLMNYAHLMDSLDDQIRRTQQRDPQSNPLCVIMADLDHFKQINDTYGHMVGDLVLQHVADRIQSAVRDLDMIGRFGGEEFVIIMANADLELARLIAERVRHGIMNAPIHVNDVNIDVTLSLGVAMLQEGERKESLLERADAAMYEAKRGGRNRVVAVHH